MKKTCYTPKKVLTGYKPCGKMSSEFRVQTLR